MDRRIVYPSEAVLETDYLWLSRYVQASFGKLAQALLGQSTAVNGLPLSPGVGLTVSLGAGEIYSMAQVDATAFSTLPADATHTVLKQGTLRDPVVLNTPAPATAGQSVVYLIEVQLQENDTDNTVLPYFNSANPLATFNGPNAQPTRRACICAFQAKAGVAAATGSQVAPAVDAGWTALYSVTVTYGEAAVSAADVQRYPGAPFIDFKLFDLGGKYISAPTTLGLGVYLADTSGGAFAVAVNPTPVIPSSVRIIDVAGAFSAHHLTLSLAAAGFFNPLTGTVVYEDLILDEPGADMMIAWTGQHWRII